MNKDEALEIALDYIRRTSHWEKGRDRHDTLKAVEAALAQPWPDLTKRDRESYQKGHNDGVAHHKQLVKAAQPAQEPVAFNEFLESEDFYNLMQTYRHFQTDAVKPFEAVKDALRAAYNIGANP